MSRIGVVPQVPPSTYLGRGSQEPGKNRGVEVADGVELVTCELEHGQMPDVAPSTSPVHMPGLNVTASSGTPCILPDARSGSEWRSAEGSWTHCILPEALSSTELKSKKTGIDDTLDDCCDAPPISAPRPSRAGRKRGGEQEILESQSVLQPRKLQKHG